MKISPWHMELAKRIAQGQTNRDIMKEVKVSGSRLSILKANPVFANQIEKYRKIEADKYRKAIGVFGEAAEKVAKELVRMVDSPLTPHKTRLDTGLAILDRVAQSEGVQAGTTDGEEVVFEQMLRVTKKGMGLDRASDSADKDATDVGKAERELEEDLEGVSSLGPDFNLNQLQTANI